MRWHNELSKGAEYTFVLWRTRRHKWEIRLLRDRVHRNGNYMWSVEFVRCSRPPEVDT